ncbi:MAG: hypothetical protein ABIK92_11335 [Pseudomonadota bacterium]
MKLNSYCYLLIFVLIFLLIPSISLAEIEPEVDCSDAKAANNLMINFETVIDKILKEGQTNEDKHKKIVSAISQKMDAKKVWSEKEKSDFLSNIVASSEYIELEKKKQEALKSFNLSLESLSQLQNKNQAGHTSEGGLFCESANKCIKDLKKVISFTDSQWVLMESKTLQEAIRLMEKIK